MSSFSDIRDWDLSGLELGSRALAQRAAGLEQYSDAVRGAGAFQSWAGAASDQARALAGVHADHGDGMAAQAKALLGPLDDYARGGAELKAAARSLISEAAAHGYSIGDDGSVVATAPQKGLYAKRTAKKIADQAAEILNRDQALHQAFVDSVQKALADEPAGQKGPAGSPKDLVVVASNAFHLPAAIDKNDPQQRAAEEVQTLKGSGADLIAASEVNGKYGQQVLDGLKSEYPYQTAVVGKDRPDGGGGFSPFSVNGGVALLSKYPILQQHELVYNARTLDSPELVANKGAVLAQVDVGGTPVWMVATHTQADDSLFSPNTHNQEVRVEQMKELRQFVDRYVKPGEPVIYSGDLNVEYYGGQDRKGPDGLNDFQELEKSSGIHFADPSQYGYTYDASTNPLAAQESGGNTKYRDTLDYIGVTGAAKVDSVEAVRFASGQIPSDHYPVKATVEIPDNPQPNLRVTPPAEHRGLLSPILDHSLLDPVSDAVADVEDALNQAFHPKK